MNFSATYTSAELLQEYKANGIVPGDDPINHLRISAQGGLLAGATNLGGLDVLADQEYLAHPQGIDAISAAVFNIMAVRSGKTREALGFYKNALESGFINRWILPSPMNMDVLQEFAEKEIDKQAVLGSPVELGIALTRLSDCQPVAVSSRTLTEDTLIPTAMAAVHLPIVAGRPRGLHIDGGYSWENNRRLSEHFGATHVFELSNSPYKTWKFQKWPTRITGLSLALASRRPANFKHFEDFAKRQETTINGLQPDGAEIYYPSAGIELPGALTTDKRVIELGFIAGQNAVCRALGIPVKGVEIPKPVQERAVRLFGRIALPKRIFSLSA